jgi:hypothetical protein
MPGLSTQKLKSTTGDIIIKYYVLSIVCKIVRRLLNFVRNCLNFIVTNSCNDKSSRRHILYIGYGEVARLIRILLRLFVNKQK